MSSPFKHGQVHANGLRFEYLEAGSGPLVLCVHGFPDTPHGYADVMRRLAADGYRVVAPFTRGIAPSQAPDDDDYGVLTLGQDIVSLITALGAEKATLIGHDWGAVMSYAAVARAPERVERLVTIAIPPLRITTPTPAWLAMVTFFQLTPLAIRALPLGGGALVDRIYRLAAPTWRFDAEDTAPFKEVLARPGGARGTLGTYRSIFRKLLTDGRKVPEVLTRPIAVPSMVVVGTNDPTLVPKVVARIPGEFSGPFELVTLTGTGHFPHREQPEEFYRHLSRFLGKTRAA